MTNRTDNEITNPRDVQTADSFNDICERRYSRRTILKAGALSGSALALGGLAACSPEYKQSGSEPLANTAGAFGKADTDSSFNFTEISHGIDKTHHVAPDHQADLLLRWGDPLFDSAPEFDANNQSVDAQLQQFGFNNDYIGYLALDPQDADERALLCVNHEYPSHGLMFPGFGSDPRASMTEELVHISQAASGNTIVEVARRGNQWQVDKNSKYNRRLNALNTEFEVRGPAAGHPRMRTSADPQGTTVIGTINNCAGGMTPWGTYLTCEENFNYYFSSASTEGHPESENYKRYNFGFDLFHWSTFDKRFDRRHEPNESNRFGWVVEIDPTDPQSTPIKRTALGRFKHEGGENILAPSGQLVIYMGDDQRFEYLYKFVTRDAVNLEDRLANKDLLDHGTLYVAKFNDDASLEWMALEHSNPVLAASFDSQADILIQPRSAADLLKATPMDRPEDVVPNPATGKVYVMLTNNTRRQQGNVANRRAPNPFGHIIEITEGDDDHAGTSGRWDTVVECGNPADSDHDSTWNQATTENGWFASPDNAAVDAEGRLWIATDQGEKVPLTGTSDGLWSLETEGPLRGTGKMFFRVPVGAELCGPIFSEDGESLFVSIQHPGDIDTMPGVARFDTATTLWPDFKPGTPPRPSLMVVRRKGGGRVG